MLTTILHYSSIHLDTQHSGTTSNVRASGLSRLTQCASGDGNRPVWPTAQPLWLNSLASWDAEMALPNYSDTEKFNFKVSSSELSNTMTIMFGKFFTLYFSKFIPRSKFFNPTCRRLFFSSSSSSLLCSRRTASRAWWRYQPE